MKHMICGMLSACVGIFCFPAYGDWESSVLPKGYSTESSFERATQAAKGSEKSVIVYYTRTNCPPCQVLQSNLRREEIRAAYEPRYVFTVVWGNGMDSREREEYRTKYKVFGAPTWIIYNRQGEYLCTSSGGFANPEAGLRLHQVLQDVLISKIELGTEAPRNCSSLPKAVRMPG